MKITYTLLILLTFLLALIIECQGTSTKKAKRHALEEESIKDIESREESKAVESDSSSGSDTEFMEDFKHGNFSEPFKTKSEADSQGDDDDEESGTEILETEGQPGWMKKLLKQGKEKKNDSFKGNFKSGGLGNTQLEDEIPSGPFNKLRSAFSKLGEKATGAKKGLLELKGKWETMESDDRDTLTQTLQSAASNIDKFAKGGDDPIAAIQGALDVIGQFAALAGPKGQIVAVALSFISGFLSLFGAAAEKKKSIGEIVREEIEAALDKYREQDLKTKAGGVASSFAISKEYVDHLAQLGRNLTVLEVASLERQVPLYNGLEFMGTLASEIKSLLKKNERKDAKKTLRYIEMYTTVAALKDMIMQEAAAIYPMELEENRRALLRALARVHAQQKNLLEFLRAGKPGEVALNYFDPDKYKITDSYLTAVLKVPDYDRSLAGIWCLTPSIKGQPLVPISWETKMKQLMNDGHAYVIRKNKGCFWKLIPHGNHLFTVVNEYDCPKNELCGYYLAFDELGGDRSRLTVEKEADLWEIYGTHQKRIRSKEGCYASKWCNRQPILQPEHIRIGFFRFSRYRTVTTFGLTKKNVGWIWWLTKEPIKS